MTLQRLTASVSSKCRDPQSLGSLVYNSSTTSHTALEERSCPHPRFFAHIEALKSEAIDRQAQRLILLLFSPLRPLPISTSRALATCLHSV